MSNLILICDVVSHKDKQLYGKAGDKITVITEHGEICIVENEAGNRFPVNCNKIGVEEKKEVQPPTLPLDTKPPSKPVSRKKQKAAPVNQTNLF